MGKLKIIFSFFLKRALRDKKTRFFIFLSMIPVLIFAVMAVLNLFNPGFLRGIKYLLGEMSVQFYLLILVQLLALFYGTSVISEEVDDKTLVYLTARPVSKATILLGKFSSYLLVPFMLLMIGLLGSFIFYFILFRFDITLLYYVRFVLELAGIGALHCLAYGSLSLLLGTLFKRPLIVGIIFIYGWENFAYYFPGSTRYLTLNFYLRPLLPSFNYARNSRFFGFRIEPMSPGEPVLIILLLFTLFLILSICLFRQKEYLIADTD